MTPRFRLLAAAYVMLLLYVFSEGNTLFGGILDVFAGLGALLVLSVMALWPGSGRPERVEDALCRRSWADRVRLAKGTEPNDEAGASRASQAHVCCKRARNCTALRGTLRWQRRSTQARAATGIKPA